MFANNNLHFLCSFLFRWVHSRFVKPERKTNALMARLGRTTDGVVHNMESWKGTMMKHGTFRVLAHDGLVVFDTWKSFFCNFLATSSHPNMDLIRQSMVCNTISPFVVGVFTIPGPTVIPIHNMAMADMLLESPDMDGFD
jgi:hypothetical protein